MQQKSVFTFFYVTIISLLISYSNERAKNNRREKERKKRKILVAKASKENKWNGVDRIAM